MVILFKKIFLGGSGRTGGGQSKQIIGKVILHDKLKYWSGKKGVHYHTSTVFT